MNLLISICARGGSKGIPRKNVRLVAGLPLIAYSIRTALKLKSELGENNHVQLALSTDNHEIKETALLYGLDTDYVRPAHLGTDTVGKIDVLKDLYQYHCQQDECSYDLLLDLDVTSPLRTVEDLRDAMLMIQNDDDAINLFSVSSAHRNPYFNMVEIDNNGYAHKCKELSHDILTRQSSPKVYDLNASFYFYKRTFFDDHYNTVYTPKTLAYEVPHICFDVDESIDLEILDFLLTHEKLDFEI